MLGMGSGQPNRLESLRIAFRKAGEDAKGAALASDAFFPFGNSITYFIFLFCKQSTLFIVICWHFIAFTNSLNFWGGEII